MATIRMDTIQKASNCFTNFAVYLFPRLSQKFLPKICHEALSTFFSPNRPDALPQIFTTLGLDYDDRVLPSITNEVLKAVVAQFDAGELITQREMVLFVPT